jgi:flagellar basal body P-ring formation protein FlgA
MIFERSFLTIIYLLTLLNTNMAYGATGTEHISKAVAVFLGQQLHVLENQYGDQAKITYTISKLDPRLSMPDCPQALSTESKSLNSIGRMNIKVSCQQTALWSLYVPVSINVTRPVVSVIEPIAKGSQIDAGQLQLREMDISKLNGSYFTSLKNVIGMQARRPLRPDRPVLASQLQQPVMIKKGESVLVSATSGSLVVKIPGTALMDGRKGQQINIRNQQSKRIIKGRVIAPGQVTVPM